MLRADLHIHSCYSFDCTSNPSDIIQSCLKKGINCIAITDHGTVEGGLRVREIAPFPVIVGQEVLTTRGELMGFFLTQSIPTGLRPEEAIDRIAEQGGVVGVPHPFDRLIRSNLGWETLTALAPRLQVIEGFNARSLWPQGAAVRFAREHGLVLSAGSDAHTPQEIGTAYVEMPPFSTPQEFLASLAQGKVRGHRVPFWTHGLGAWRHFQALGRKVK